MIADVQDLIDAQAKAAAARSVDDSYFDNYHPSDEVYAYLDSLVSSAPPLALAAPPTTRII